ncbi:MAG: hypothetical protein NTY19_16580 [Planctomycetota bacterium]|nr:hypothetical protein [Planctomycetota bacterium]
MVIITVRPHSNSFHPHNIALKKAQAVRLLKDLESLLKVSVVVLMACLVLVAAGCSARVEVERGNKTDSTASEAHTAEISRATVDVDLHPRPSLPQPTPPIPVVPESRPVTITGNSVVLNYRTGDVTYHSDVHVHEPAQRHIEEVEETVVIRREVHSVPPRPVDPRCELFRKQHEERVRRWKAFPLEK